jgi:KICSTOR complex C12orf66 like
MVGMSRHHHGVLAGRTVAGLQSQLVTLSRALVSMQGLAESAAEALRRVAAGAPDAAAGARAAGTAGVGGSGDAGVSAQDHSGTRERDWSGRGPRGVDASDWGAAAEALGSGVVRPVQLSSFERARLIASREVSHARGVLADARGMRGEVSSSLAQLEKVVQKESRNLSHRRGRDSVYSQLMFDISGLLPGVHDRWVTTEDAWKTVDRDAEDFMRQEEDKASAASGAAETGTTRGLFGRLFSSRHSDRVVSVDVVTADAATMDGIVESIGRLGGLVAEAGDIVKLRLELNDIYADRLAIAPAPSGAASSTPEASSGDHDVLPDYEAILASVLQLLERTSTTLSHPDVAAVKEHLSFELESLAAVVNLQLQVSQLQFVPSVLAVMRVHRVTGEWRAFLTRAVGAELLDSSSGVPHDTIDVEQDVATASLSLISHMFALLLSKVGLYFNGVLLQKEYNAGADVQSLAAAMTASRTNFVQLIDNYVAKSDVTNVSIIADLQAVGRPIESAGYVCPPEDNSEDDEPWEAPGGRAGWPAYVICSPQLC